MTRDEASTIPNPGRDPTPPERRHSDADVKRAAKQLGVFERSHPACKRERTRHGCGAPLEPNHRGKQAYEGFVRDQRQALDPRDIDLALLDPA
jgi:hypothetical protein